MFKHFLTQNIFSIYFLFKKPETIKESQCTFQNNQTLRSSSILVKLPHPKEETICQPLTLPFSNGKDDKKVNNIFLHLSQVPLHWSSSLIHVIKHFYLTFLNIFSHALHIKVFYLT